MKNKYYNFKFDAPINLSEFLGVWLDEVKKNNIGSGRVIEVKLTDDKYFQMTIEYNDK